MVYDYIWANANPELRPQLRQGNEARAAAFYAAWNALGRAITAPLRRRADRIGRRRRAANSLRELSALSDRALADIGLARGELPGVAETVASTPPDVALTVADYRRLRDGGAGGPQARVAALPAPDGRRRRLEPRTGGRTAARPGAARDRAQR